VAVAGFLCARWPEADGTYYRPIRRVRPGFRVLFRGTDPGTWEEHRSWRLEEPRSEDDWLSDDEADRFPEWLDGAVARSSLQSPAENGAPASSPPSSTATGASPRDRDELGMNRTGRDP
jgi:hypothetical protein